MWRRCSACSALTAPTTAASGSSSPEKRLQPRSHQPRFEPRIARLHRLLPAVGKALPALAVRVGRSLAHADGFIGSLHIAGRRQHGEEALLHFRRPLLHPRPRDLHPAVFPLILRSRASGVSKDAPAAPPHHQLHPIEMPPSGRRFARPTPVRPEPVEGLPCLLRRRPERFVESRIALPLRQHPGPRRLGQLRRERDIPALRKRLEEGLLARNTYL
jgi:hypothetical protein